MTAPAPYYPPELRSWPELVNKELAYAVDYIKTERTDIKQITYIDVDNGQITDVDVDPSIQNGVELIIHFDVDPENENMKFVSVPAPAIAS